VSVADAHCFGVVGDGVHDVRTIFNNNCRGGCVGRARAWESLRRPSRNISYGRQPITRVRYHGHACLPRRAGRRSRWVPVGRTCATTRFTRIYCARSGYVRASHPITVKSAHYASTCRLLLPRALFIRSVERNRREFVPRHTPA